MLKKEVGGIKQPSFHLLLNPLLPHLLQVNHVLLLPLFCLMWDADQLVSVSWERGYPDLPACGLGRGSSSSLVRPIFINNHSRTSRGGQRKTSSGAASLGWLPRSGDIYARGTSRGVCDVSHDDQHR